jgi:hypothetical protein
MKNTNYTALNMKLFQKKWDVCLNSNQHLNISMKVKASAYKVLEDLSILVKFAKMRKTYKETSVRNILIILYNHFTPPI